MHRQATSTRSISFNEVMNARFLRALLAIAILASAPRVVAAPSPTSVRETLSEPARAAFDEASRLYREKRYVEARDGFLGAHRLSGDARILFNVGVCEKALGQYARAIRTFEQSLAAADRSVDADYAERVAEAIKTLSRYVAVVTVTSTVGGVDFSVDGEPLLENPTSLDAGPHTFMGTKIGYQPASRTVTLTAGKPETVNLDPSPIAAPSAPSGDRPPLGPLATVAHLRVTTDRPGDAITIDGAIVARSGSAIELPPGEHQVVITRSDGGSRTLEILLRENERRDVRVVFEEKKGLSPWWFIGGGVLLAGAVTTAAILLSQPTRFEGSGAGTLSPFVVTASMPGGGQ